MRFGNCVPSRLLSVALLPVALWFSHVALGDEDFEVTEINAGIHQFLVPERVNEITVEVWGAGGSGEETNSGGGGGGGYSRQRLDVNPGQEYTYQVGAGAPEGSDDPGESSWFGSESQVLAQGGESASGRSGAFGASASNGVGEVRYSGGGGASGVFASRGGGGGSSAGTGSDGAPGNDGFGGSAPGGGGDGGDAGSTVLVFFGGEGEPGVQPGGGGGGGGSFQSGGAGASGQVRITYSQLELACSETFSDDSGRNDNLLGSDRNFDLSDIPWENNSWPASGSTLEGGAYYFGSSPGGAYNLQVAEDEQVVIFVDGSVNLGNNASLNESGNPEQLTIVTRESFNSGNNLIVNGFIYAAGAVNTGNNLDATGAFAAAGAIDLGRGNQNFRPDPDAASAISVPGVCSGDDDVVDREVDHFRMAFSPTALTCQPLKVSLSACANDDCSELFTGAVDADLSPSGWVEGDSVSFSGGTIDGLELQQTTPDVYSPGVSSSTPSASNETRCQSSSTPAAPDQCEVEFRESGFALTIREQTANRPSEPVQIQAVERADEDNACVPAFGDVSRDVDFWSQYIDPDAGGMSVRVNEGPVGGSESEATGISLDFDSTGTAEFELLYPDAGLMQLNARYEGSEENGDEGLVLPGSDNWVSVPQGYCVETGFECETADGSCPASETAGEPFDLNLTAVGWQDGANDDLCSDNPTTPNFEQSNLTLTHELVAPDEGDTGAISETAYDHGIGSGPVEVGQSVSEVGVFRFGVEEFGDYFGETVPGGLSQPSGRVIPARFSVTQEQGELLPPCSVAEPFAYIGEAISMSTEQPVIYEIEALNASGNRTQNYTVSDFQRLTAADLPIDILAEIAENNGDPYPLDTDGITERLEVPDGPSGVMDFVVSGDVIFEKDAEIRPAPLDPDLEISLSSFSDADGVSSSFGDVIEALAVPLPEFKVRYGRLRLENAYGPETLPLVLPMQTEYWNGERFVVNEAEDGFMENECWQYSPSSDPQLLEDIVTDNVSSDETFGFDGGKPDPGLESNEPSEDDGRIWLRFTGDIDVNNQQRVRFPVDIELRDDFDDDGELESPEATATFGVYRGHDRIIYWREVQ